LLAALALWTRGISAGEFSGGEKNRAEKLYKMKCAKCHKFYDPSGYSDREWDEWMVKMKKKARLNSTQYESLLRYTQDMRAKDTRQHQR
jgi:hypothetical protein